MLLIHGIALQELRQLSRLDLSRTGVTDTTISPLTTLRHLKHLSLAHCDLTDKALEAIKDLYLGSLDITKCKMITNKGLNCLPYIDR